MGSQPTKIEYKAGDIVGRLAFVEERSPWHGERMAIFKCLEDGCGKEFITIIRAARDERSTTCGCAGRKRFRQQTIERNTTHGMSTHPLYGRWGQIKIRCYNTNSHAYDGYGGRGIKMYEPWITDFQAFHDYVISLDSYNEEDILSGKLSLDRYPNNDGNYEPGNLRWATGRQQILNRSSKRGGTSFSGVYARGGKFRSHLVTKGKRFYFGTFDTDVQAVEARDWFIIKNGLWEYSLQVVRSTA